MRLWLDYYFGEAKCDATAAARLCGYADPGQSGYDNKKKLESTDEFKAKAAAITMSQEEVRLRLAEMARGDMNDVTSQSGEFDWDTARANGKTHLIKKIKQFERTFKTDKAETIERVLEVELHDAKDALKTIATMHGMMKGGALEVEMKPVKTVIIHLDDADEPQECDGDPDAE